MSEDTKRGIKWILTFWGALVGFVVAAYCAVYVVETVGAAFGPLSIFILLALVISGLLFALGYFRD